MKKHLQIVALFSCVVTFGQTTGDIAFVGFNSDGEDDFAIVALADIPANTTIYFTDNESDGLGGLTTGEGAIEWQTGGSIISAGTVITFTDTDAGTNPGFGASTGTLVDGTGNMNLAATGDAIFAFLGSDDTTPTTFLAGIQNGSENEGDLAGTGLTSGSTFVEFYSSANPDGGVYSGSRDTEVAFADYLTLIGNSNNWTEEVSDGELLLPFSTTSFSTIATITWDGETDTNWGTASNWDGDVLPTSLDNVLLPDVSSGSGNNPVISVGVVGQINDLIISTGGSLSVESGGSLAIFGDAVVDGSFSVERNMTGGDGTPNSAGYSIGGVPVSDGEIQDFDAQFIFSYVNPSGFTTNLNTSSEAASPGTGFFVGYDASSPSITFTGTPNTGDVTYTVTESSGFELIANPYTAAITTGSFLADNSTIITGGVYFWDDGGSNTGGSRGGDYVTVTAMGTASAVQPNGSDDGIAGSSGTAGASNGFIPSIQGVFVDVMAAGDITFSTSQISTSATANSDGNYYRRVDYQKVKLAIQGNGLYNEVLIGLGADATFGPDSHLDARKFETDNPLSFYSLLADEKFVIQGLPLVRDEAIKAQLGFDLAEAGDYQIKVILMENIPPIIGVRLRDNLTGEVYDVEDGFSTDFSSNIVQNDLRFELEFSPSKVLNVEEPLQELKVYGVENRLIIEDAGEGAKELAIYDLSGKITFHQKINLVNNKAVIHPKLENEKIYVLRLDQASIKFILK